jgi:hypothetical protein
MRAEYKGATFQKANATYKQTYKPTQRRRWYRRLTPLAWFCVALLFAGALALGSLVVNAVSQRAQQFVPLAAVVAAPATAVAPASAAPAQPMPTAAPARATAAPTARPTLAPTVVPTALPALAPAVINGAPWAADLKRMPDGTLGAPAFVVEKARADLREWWVLNQVLDATLLVEDPQKLLSPYFADDALADQLKQLETGRFTLIREGRFTLEIKAFSEDGMTAQAGVVLRGRVETAFNARNGRVLNEAIAGPDTLTLMTVRYDPAEHRWKVSRINDVIELK